MACRPSKLNLTAVSRSGCVGDDGGPTSTPNEEKGQGGSFDSPPVVPPLDLPSPRGSSPTDSSDVPLPRGAVPVSPLSRDSFGGFRPSKVQDSEYEAQAEMLEEGDPNMAMSTQVITTFADSLVTSGIGTAAGNHTYGGSDGTLATDIAAFFQRPVQIGTATWTSASNLGETISIVDAYGATWTENCPIWRLWNANPAVQRKLSNFAFFRGDLKLKFQVLASPFYYGHARAAYRPMQNFNPETIDFGASAQHLIPFSHRPHVDILPGVATSFEMLIPFIWNKNWVGLSGGVTGDMDSMGTLRLMNYAPLDSANGQTGESLNIVIYAWVENIRLSGATCYVPQSDEYNDDGVVSKPASAVAKIARSLFNIPVIGPFARATDIGASAVASIARLFGYTNVPILDNTMPVRNEQFPKFASPDISYPIEKLTVDAKNELSIDPRIVGLPNGDDEMSIRHLCGRESWLCQTTWATSTQQNTLLFQSRVNPYMYDSAFLAAPQQATTSVWYTPMGWVCNAFDNWRGTIIFRFHVVCTKYHKGRLLISFDPSGSGNTTSGNNIGQIFNATNIVHTAILDIGLSNNVEFSVPYQQATQFLQCRTDVNPTDSGSRAWTTSQTSAWAINPSLDNGYINIRVLNTLTAPVTDNSVKINVYVRGGDDLEFANPTDIDPLKRLSYYKPQSAVLTETTPGLIVGDAPTSGTADVQYAVHFGEKIVSLRPLLRRFNLLGADFFSTSSVNDQMTTFTKKMFKMPMSPGYCPNGYNYANKIGAGQTGTAPYNWCAFTYMSYFSQGFLAYRGSTNYSFNLSTHTSEMNHIRAFRDNLGRVTNSSGQNRAFAKVSYDSVPMTNFSTANAAVARIVSQSYSGMSGQSLVNNVTQSGLNVALPNYSQYSFCATSTAFANTPTDVQDGSSDDGLVLEIQTCPNKPSTERVVVYTYCAAGTDFGFYYFVNVPALYLYPSTPTI